MTRQGGWGRNAGLLALLWTGPLAGQGSSYEQLQTFSSVLNQVRLTYVDSVAYGELVHAAIDGLLSSLDPHSVFLTRSQAEQWARYETGQLAGLGLVLDDVDGTPTVLSVLPRSPAARGGVAAGDRVVMLNDTSVAGLASRTLTLRLVGEKGRKIKLLLERGARLEPDSVRLTLEQDYLDPRSVTVSRMADSITGYIRLQEFHPQAGEEVERALKDLKHGGAKRVVLDLRGDPGGVVGASGAVASLFLPKASLVFRTQGRVSSINQDLSTTRDGPFRDLPLMVLIDEGTASASEALAGSLQDHDRALILGRRSFGKALVMQMFPIPPQGDAVLLTIGRVVTPSGRVIQRSYRGLKTGQYYAFAGRAGAPADTLKVYHTDMGREVRGGGGIVPDVLLPPPAPLPAWFSAAADSGFIEAVADSVAVLLPKDPAGLKNWIDAPGDWDTRVVVPFLARLHDRLAIRSEPAPELRARLGRILAHRVTEVRWGPDAADAFVTRNDPDIKEAMAQWGRITELTRTPPGGR
jgi:carboxyl-terminal processing protease